MAVGCFDPPTFLHNSSTLSSIWSNSDWEGSNSDDSLSFLPRKATHNDVFNESFFALPTENFNNIKHDFHPPHQQPTSSTSDFGAIGQMYGTNCTAGGGRNDMKPTSSAVPKNNLGIKSCWTPIPQDGNNLPSWTDSSGWGSAVDQISSSSDDSLRSELLTTSPMIHSSHQHQQQPQQNSWQHADNAMGYTDPIRRGHQPSRTSKPQNSVYDTYNNDNEYTLLQDFAAKLNLNGESRHHFAAPTASNSTRPTHVSAKHAHPASAMSPQTNDHLTNDFGHNSNAFNNYAKPNQRLSYSPGTHEKKVVNSYNVWNNGMFNGYPQQQPQQSMPMQRSQQSMVHPEPEVGPRSLKNVFSPPIQHQQLREPPQVHKNNMMPPQARKLPLSPPQSVLSHNSSSCNEAELKWYHKNLELQQSVYEHVYHMLLGAPVPTHPTRASIATAAAAAAASISPYQTRRNPMSIEFHQKVDECTDHYRRLEKERKKTEAELARHNLGKKISSTNNLPIPRLPPAPSRIDRLVVDFFREHARIVTLLLKMEQLKQERLDPRIHETMHGLLDAIRTLQQCRLSERCAILNHLKGEIGSYNEEQETAKLFHAMACVNRAVLRARAANFCSLIWSIGPENDAQLHKMYQIMDSNFEMEPPEIKLRAIVA